MRRRDLRDLLIIMGVFMVVGFINQTFFYVGPLLLLIGLLWMLALLYKKHGKHLSKVWLIMPWFTVAIYTTWLLMFYLDVYLYTHLEDYLWYRMVFGVVFTITFMTAFFMGGYLLFKSIQKRLAPCEE